MQHERGPRKPKELSPLSVKIPPSTSSFAQTPSPDDVTRYDSPGNASKVEVTPPSRALKPHLLSNYTALDLSRSSMRHRHSFAPYPLTAPRLPRFFPPPQLTPTAFPGLLMPASLSLAHNVITAERLSHDVTRQHNALTPAGSALVLADVTPVRESLQETGARVLFSVVHWLRCVGGFNSLPLKSQVYDFLFLKLKCILKQRYLTGRLYLSFKGASPERLLERSLPAVGGPDREHQLRVSL